MAPPKFVAPVRKPGALNSFSSALSSNSSLASVNQDSRTPTTPAAQSASSAKKQDAASNRDGAASAKKVAAKGTQELGKPAGKQIRPKAAAASSSKGSGVPPQKKRKVEPAASPAKPANVQEKGRSDSDKENINPATDTSKSQTKKPCVPLTDQDYEFIFQAVLASGSNDDTCRQSVESSVETVNLDKSTELFEFSQSDLDDSEGEQQVKTKVKEKDNATAANRGTSTAQEKNEPKKKGLKSPLDGKPKTDVETLDKINQASNDRSQLTVEAVQATPSLPDKDFTIHENLSQTEEVGGNPDKLQNNTQIEELLSQRSNDSDFNKKVPSTPHTEKKATVALSPFVTPQRTSLVSRPFALSQALNTSPAATVKKASASAPKAVIPALQQNDSSFSKKPSSVTQVSQSSQGCENLHQTPSGQSNFSRTSQPSQELRTPATPCKKSFVQTSQSSQNQETPSCTPLKRLLSTSNFGSPGVSSPSGSQQLSQTVQYTPPPAELTAKKRLFWLQKKRLTGLWVQCDQDECKKWRYLEDVHDPTALPKRWYCHMHPDQNFNNCEAPEKRMSLHAEEDMIFNKFSPGSLVWAKLSGYPWWPAMVEDDPDLEQFYWLNLFSDIPTWYHVVFFDEDGKSSKCRAWVQVERLKGLEEQTPDTDSPDLIGFKKRVAAAYKNACSAQALNIDERLAQYSFASCYKGPIGGYFKKLYSGPVGDRKIIS